MARLTMKTGSLAGRTGRRGKASLDEMVRIEGGVFAMGSDRHYPEEAPRRRVEVDAFWIDRTPVTNADFARFIADTGYRTIAEIAPDPRDYPGLTPDMAHAGSLVFTPTVGPAPSSDPSVWWRFVFGADWRRPLGPGSSIEGMDSHPVVHVAYPDAEAYAHWAGKSLPTEAEWECAAWGGREDAEFAWGDELAPDGQMLANYWQGAFPYQNDLVDGFERTSPVGAFPPNDFGLTDMIGNVWEWTSDWYGGRSADSRSSVTPASCCVVRNPRGVARHESFNPALPQERLGRKVLKGGSHLCAENYCRRYRPAARHPQSIDTSTSHIGFRCIVRR